MATQTIGEREVTLAEFSGYKGFYVGEIASRLGDRLPKWQLQMAEWRNEYGQKNKNRLTKDISDARGYGLPDSAFEKTGYVEYPAVPSPQEEILSILPEAWPYAREEITRILALVTIDDRDLEDLDEAGTVDDELLKKGKRILHEAKLDEIAALIAYARSEVSGKLGGVLDGALGSSSPDSPEPSEEETSGSSSPEQQAEQGDPRRTELELPTVEEEESPTSTSSPSSIASEPPTGGPEPSPSTASAGAPSSSSTD
jgi:hypothetical protein